jgi:hypothetical protein
MAAAAKSLARAGPTRSSSGASSPYTIGASLLPPPAPPVAEEQVKDIALGTSLDEVVRKLGEPYMRVTGDYERLTYRIAAGNAAKLEFEAGKLTRLEIVWPVVTTSAWSP